MAGSQGQFGRLLPPHNDVAGSSAAELAPGSLRPSSPAFGGSTNHHTPTWEGMDTTMQVLLSDLHRYLLPGDGHSSGSITMGAAAGGMILQDSSCEAMELGAAAGGFDQCPWHPCMIHGMDLTPEAMSAEPVAPAASTADAAMAAIPAAAAAAAGSDASTSEVSGHVAQQQPQLPPGSGASTAAAADIPAALRVSQSSRKILKIKIRSSRQGGSRSSPAAAAPAVAEEAVPHPTTPAQPSAQIMTGDVSSDDATSGAAGGGSAATKGRSRTSIPGHPGIYRLAKGGYHVQLSFGERKTVHVGTFATREEAIQQAERARQFFEVFTSPKKFARDPALSLKLPGVSQHARNTIMARKQALLARHGLYVASTCNDSGLYDLEATHGKVTHEKVTHGFKWPAGR